MAAVTCSITTRAQMGRNVDVEKRTSYVGGMSKAFTRESDEASGGEIAPLRPHLPPGTKRYITKEGADRLRQQANALLD